MNLIIVESPTKARTLTRYLKGNYRVEASMGHVRDLPKSTLGVDVAHNFEPSYIVPKEKKQRVKELKELAKKADSVILATDPDREGEAIAWHVASLLASSHQPSAVSNKKKAENGGLKVDSFQRIVFHEITQHAIIEALEHPREIDLKLVDAQQARRVLDRLVGYKLSPLLWQKLSRRWLSAGRVQSVTVRLIVEREREITKFAKEEYWTIAGEFLASKGPTFEFKSRKVGPLQNSESNVVTQLIAHGGVKYEKVLTFDLFDGKYSTTSSAISSQLSAVSIIKDLKDPFTVSAVDKKEVKRLPAPPYTTSTLQQDAGRRLYFSAKRTMQVAQKLYEEGLITYHRTDSVNLAEKFIGEARGYISTTLGKDYVSDQARRYHTKSKVAQEAHEAIRPTDVRALSNQLSAVSPELNRDHVRLYDLIWKRAVGSQAAEAVFDSTTISVTSSNGYLFQAQGSVIKFEGFLKIVGRDIEETIVPPVSVGESVSLSQAIPTQHFTNPPPRYTEASLVKTLEEKDIGRPSTYAPILSTIQDRQYVTREDLPDGRQGKKLVPTELGNTVTDFLVKYFAEVMDLPFTADLEAKLDAIATGESEWIPVLSAFYDTFSQKIDASYKDAVKVKVVEETTDESCPKCGNPLVIRIGRYGKFVACSTFPKCDYTRQFAEKIDKKCPRCGGDIVVKKSRHGKTFYGCSNYPSCNFAAWKKEDIR